MERAATMPQLCFKLNIFHDNFAGNVYEHFFLRNTGGCYQYRNPSQTAFVEITSSPKYLRSGLCWSHVFIRTELQSTTQNSSKIHHRCYYEGDSKLLHRKLLKISRKIMYVIEFPFNKIVRVYSTAYYRLKKSTTDTFLELQAF